MKGAVLVKHGGANKAFEIKEVGNPKISGLEVLIRVEAFGLNYADVMARNGLYDAAPPLPSILGYDVVGEVVEVATNEAEHLIGKRVVAMTRFGGYAEYAKTDYRACAIISNDMHAAKATALATQYSTAYFAAYECVNLFENDYILLHAAAGGVGTAITQLAKLKGAKVIGLTSSDKKIDYLKQIGVDFPVNYMKNEYREEVLKITKKEGVDVAFNSVGGSTFKKDKSVLATTGRQVVYGAAEMSGKRPGIITKLGLAKKFGIYSPIPLMIQSKGIIGINMLAVADNKQMVIKRCLEEVVRLTESKKIDPQIGGEFPVAEIGDAHAFLESRKSTGKIVVKW